MYNETYKVLSDEKKEWTIMDNSVVESISAKVCMLGRFSITVGEASVADDMNRSKKMWSSLAYLVHNRDRLVMQKELIEQFWAGENTLAAANALKTLFYRIRALLEPLFPADFNPIISRRGGYIWNPAINTTVDTVEFEELCVKAGSITSATRRLDLYSRAIALYQGKFLPGQKLGTWTAPVVDYYHKYYLEAVIAYTDLLKKDERYEEVTIATRTAAAIDPYDETIATTLISSLLAQDRNREALVHYERVSELLYKTRDLRPSQALRDIYEKIMESENDPKTDLSIIQSELEDLASTNAAFICEYGIFREIYRLESRRCARSGESIHIALVTLITQQGEIPDVNKIGNTMDNVLKVITSCLRRGDVVAKYSGAQYLLMLPSTNYDNCAKVLKRIESTFRRQHRTSALQINSKIRELKPM